MMLAGLAQKLKEENSGLKEKMAESVGTEDVVQLKQLIERLREHVDLFPLLQVGFFSLISFLMQHKKEMDQARESVKVMQEALSKGGSSKEVPPI